MAFLSTAISAIGKIAGAGLTALGAYSAIAPAFQKQRSIPAFSGGAYALPGGAPTMAGYGLPLALGAGALGAYGLTTPGSPYGGIMEPGGFLGGGSQIVPVPTRGGYRMPHQVMVPHPSQPGNYVTYVKAPPVRYRVSVRGYKRRCSTGGW